MENTFEELKARCKAAGTTLRKVCLEAGVQVSTVWYWKNHEPTQITTYNKLLQTIDKLASKSDDATTTTVSE